MERTPTVTKWKHYLNADQTSTKTHVNAAFLILNSVGIQEDIYNIDSRTAMYRLQANYARCQF